MKIVQKKILDNIYFIKKVHPMHHLGTSTLRRNSFRKKILKKEPQKIEVTAVNDEKTDNFQPTSDNDNDDR
jgi:hypothetical protein